MWLAAAARDRTPVWTSTDHRGGKNEVEIDEATTGAEEAPTQGGQLQPLAPPDGDDSTARMVASLTELLHMVHNYWSA